MTLTITITKNKKGIFVELSITDNTTNDTCGKISLIHGHTAVTACAILKLFDMNKTAKNIAKFSQGNDDTRVFVDIKNSSSDAKNSSSDAKNSSSDAKISSVDAKKQETIIPPLRRIIIMKNGSIFASLHTEFIDIMDDDIAYFSDGESHDNNWEFAQAHTPNINNITSLQDPDEFAKMSGSSDVFIDQKCNIQHA